MKFERASGIILHPTSLPGPFGIGDIGPQAHEWLEYLAESGCALWQILPLGPTGYGDSPYQCFSAFAGNPYIISLESLVDDGLLRLTDLESLPDFPETKVDFGRVIPWKLGLLDQAFTRFEHAATPEILHAHTSFQEEHQEWLEDYALFMALKEAHEGAPWTKWETPLRDRHPQALAGARRRLQEAIHRQVFRQFIFYRQWASLHEHALQLGIQIIGDIPIFVAHDSADVWSHPELFYLNNGGMPTVIAGVPPDYFSPTGQLWGNPLYRWDMHLKSGYNWWLERFRAVLSMVDIVRLDHFRGYAKCWEVSADEDTAIYGQWVDGPGAHFLETVRNNLVTLPFIAEDLGIITDDVIELRDRFNLPGMKILLFAFQHEPRYLPHLYTTTNCVAYTGTHDNDTIRGWYERIDEDERVFYRRYLARDGSQVTWDLIRACWSSIASFALAPMQDFLNLGNEARMNYPGNPSANWNWRMPANTLDQDLQLRIKELNHLYSRELNAELN